MMLSPTERNAVCPTLLPVPERIEEHSRSEVPDADTLAVARKLRHWLSPVVCHNFSQAHRRLVGQRFDQACQLLLFAGSESLVASALVEHRWPNRAFTRARRLTLR